MKYFKTIFCLFLCVLMIRIVEAQSVSQIKRKINNTQNTTQVDLRNQLSGLLLTNKNYKDGQIYANEAKSIAQQLNYSKGLAQAYANLGVYYAFEEEAPKETYEHHQKSFQLYKKLYQTGKLDKWIVHDFIQKTATPSYKSIVNTKKAKRKRFRNVMKSYQLLYTEMSDYLSKLAQNTQDELESTEDLIVQKTYSENILKNLKSRLEDSLSLNREERQALKNEVMAREMKIQNDSLRILQHKTEVEKHKEETARQKAETDKKEAEVGRQRMFSITLILVFVLVSAFTVFVIRNLNKQKKVNKQLELQNYQIEQQNREIQEQRNDLLTQKEILEHQKETLEQQKKELEHKTEEIATQRDYISTEKQKSETLLLNILPRKVASELKEIGKATPQKYQMVTVLFTDFKGFTKLAEQHTPEEIIEELNITFTVFDEIIERYGMERIKTIGDAYMAAGGVPTPNISNPIDVVRAGLEMQRFMNQRKQEKIAHGKMPWELRLGIHTGEIIAGVVGKKKFAYDIWGDTVNLASRMESSGTVGKVNISEATYQKVKHIFKCTYRGEIEAKNKGLVNMYFAEERSRTTLYM